MMTPRARDANRRVEWSVTSGRTSRVTVIADVERYAVERKINLTLASAMQNYQGSDTCLFSLPAYSGFGGFGGLF